MRAVLSLLSGTALLLVGNGLLTTILGTRLAAGGESLGLAGVVVSAFSVGLALGSWRGQWVILRVGHIRSFAAFSAVATAAALAIALSREPSLWIAFRVAQGFAIGGNFLAIESWLSERGGHEGGRARMLAIYVATCQVALAAGQLLVVSQPPEGMAPFALAALLYVLAVVPIALTRTPQPALEEPSRARLVDVAKKAPVAVGGCFVAGCTTGTLLNLGPPFGMAIGFSAAEVAVFMAIAVLGGLVLQFPVGRLSEQLDRRVVIELVAAGTCLTAGLLAVMQGLVAHTAAAFALGAFAFVLYPVSIAHAHDLVGPADIVPTSGTLVLAYGVGSSIAPLAGSLGLEVFGPAALPGAILAFNAALAGLAVMRLVRRRVLPVSEPVPFSPMALPQVLAAPDRDEEPAPSDEEPSVGPDDAISAEGAA